MPAPQCEESRKMKLCGHCFRWVKGEGNRMRMKVAILKTTCEYCVYKLQWLIGHSETYLGRNDISIKNCSFSQLASYNSKDPNLSRIADPECAWTSLRGQEIPSSNSCSLSLNTGDLPHHLILCDADLMCVWTFVIYKQKLQHCHK